MYNRDKFFDTVRKGVFGGKLTPKQVEGMNNILDYEESHPLPDPRYLAYMLATVYWETAHTMQPITEYGSQAYLKGKKYWPWIGRGLVQITWQDNYNKFGITNPEDALKWPNALHIMWKGMLEGMFTGKRLSHYFNATVDDPVNARRIINGTDKMKEIAAIYTKFLGALEVVKTPVVVPVEPEVIETPVAPTPANPNEPSFWGSVLVMLFNAIKGKR